MRSNAFAEDNAKTIEYFTSLLAQNGSDIRAVDWGSKNSQALRFAILADVARIDGGSVLDVGCGLGDLLEWFSGQRIEVRYTGVDITPRMIEAAARRFPQACFRVGDLLNNVDLPELHYDFIFASGLFYRRTREPYAFLEETISAMFWRCKRAVAFNSLSAWANDKDGGEFYAEPERVLSICRRLSPWVAMRHDYHPRDFTVCLYRERQES